MTGERRRILGGRYELGEPIGVGGMAEVWRARDARLDRDVAVKLLSGPGAHDASRRRRMEREARALAALSHPNIVEVYDYGEEESGAGGVTPYIVMELVDGGDLETLLADRGRLSVEQSRSILSGVLAAVGRAHEAGIVHGDLKPANVIMGPHGPKVGDFGVARILAEETGATTLAATPRFAAPEVLRGAKPTVASDVYSAAGLGFTMLTGRPPFEGANAWEVAAKHQQAPVPSVRDFRSDVPAHLDETIRRGLRKDPASRPVSADEFARRVTGDVGPEPPEAVSSSPSAETATVAIGHGTVPTGRPEHTEALPRAPDLGAAVFFGRWASMFNRLRNRVRGTPAPTAPHGRRSRVGLGTATIVAGVVVLALISFRPHGPPEVRVPDVRGVTIASARTMLQDAGLEAGDVSYRPVTEGEPGIVLDTFPATGELVADASQVHIVASAMAATPEPEPTRAPRENKGKGKGRHERDD